MILKRYEEVFAKLPECIVGADAHLETINNKTVVVNNKKVVSTESCSKSSLCVRATGDKTGIVYTENMNEDPYEVLNRAYEMSTYVDTIEKVTYASSKNSNFDETLNIETAKISELKKLAIDIETKIRNMCDYETHISGCTISKIAFYEEVVNSEGLKSNTGSSFYQMSTQVICSKNDSIGQKKIEVVFDTMNKLNLEELVKDAIITAKNQAESIKVPTGKYNVIMSSDFTNKFMYNFGMTVNGYKTKTGGSVFKNKEGHKVADSCITVRDIGYYKKCPVKYNIDVEGMPVKDTYIIKNGIFKTMLHNTLTSINSYCESTGNAGRRMTMSGSNQVAVCVTPKILFVEPGNYSKEELLVELGDGLYITEMLDYFHGVDFSSGNFSAPVSALVIKNCKVVGGIKSIIWTGNILDVFNNSRYVANNITFYNFQNSYILGGVDILVKNQNILGDK